MLLLLFVLLVVNTSFAQMQPRPGAVLHYRMIGFSFPKIKGATGYELNIYEHNDSKEKSRPVFTQQLPDNRVIATVPAFGKKYMWQVTYLKGNKRARKSKKQYFSVAANPYSDTSKSRIVVVKSANRYTDLMVFFDNTRTLYNMKGEPLWYLPVMKGITDTSVGEVRDLKITADGTITFLTTKNVYEIDYDGRILWKSDPDTSVNNIEQYHHEFTKLKNGHYLALKDTRIDSANSKVPCGTIIEYDKNKRVVWEWNFCKHIKGGSSGMHFNAFYLDEQDSVLYTSYRNPGMVVKSKYPEGYVIAQYGTAGQGKGLFYYQHNCSINSDGHLMLFNNNFDANQPVHIRNSSVPKVAIFKEPMTASDTLEKIWEFSTDMDKLVPTMSSAGGKVAELDRGEYLVCTGIPGRSFIVTKDKNVLWDALIQKNESGWKPFPIYRISPVRHSELDKLIFR